MPNLYLRFLSILLLGCIFSGSNAIATPFPSVRVSIGGTIGGAEPNPDGSFPSSGGWSNHSVNGVSEKFPSKKLYISNHSGLPFVYERFVINVSPVNPESVDVEGKVKIDWQTPVKFSSDKHYAIFAVISDKHGRVFMFLPIGKIIAALDNYAKSLPFYNQKVYASEDASFLHLHSPEQAEAFSQSVDLNEGLIWTKAPKGLRPLDYKNGYMVLGRTEASGGTYYLIDGWRGQSYDDVAKYIAKPYSSDFNRVISFWPTYSHKKWNELTSGAGHLCNSLFSKTPKN